MLIVRVELLPGGDPSRRRVIGLLEIANVSNLSETSSYAVEAEEAANHLTGTPARMASIRIDGHRRAQPVWALIHRAVAALESAEFLEI
jgi:hypothetical protein